MTRPVCINRQPRRNELRRRSRASGFTLIEMLAVLALAALVIAGLVAMIGSSLDDTRAQQAALYQSQLTAAATRLVEQNYTVLATQATTTNPVVVQMKGSSYQLSDYLPATVGATNAYSQTPCLLIYRTASSTALQALLVTEGGQTIPDPELGYIAANAGAGGGSIQSISNPKGAAIGAFGSWKVDTPNPAGKNCSGTKAGVGHLASLISYDGTQAQNADYLYRVAVPGNEQANTMQVPIVLAQQVDYQECRQFGAIAADAAGNVVNCNSDKQEWVPQGSWHWREPVPDEAALASVALPQDGEVRVTTATHRAYTYNGPSKKWQPLAVDETGNLALGNTQTVNGDCTAAAAASPNTTLVTTDSTGRVLSCRNGTWQTQAEIEPGPTLTDCQLIMANPGGAGDYSACRGQPATNFQSGRFSYQEGSGANATTATGTYSYQAANGTYSYTFTTTVKLTKPGIIVAATWAHMNDGVCNGAPGNRAQLSQSVDIYNGNNTNIAHTESQSPTLTDDSGGINNALAQSGDKDTYTIIVTTNWANYDGATTPWVSSFCGNSGPIQNTPIAAGWTINSYY